VSSPIWTPRAVASEARVVELALWRAVEAQHVASTRRLVDSVEEQKVLEEVLERTKPRIASSLEKFHYLLSTPFRYPPGMHGSRFRSAADTGVFYAAEAQRTACAEVGYWRWRFLADSAGLESLGPAPQTLFQVKAKGRAVDLRKKPFVRDQAKWRHPADYTATQAFARAARQAPVGMIRYESVRDPEKGGCAALLEPAAFARRAPVAQQTWHLTVTRDASAWQRDGEAFEFRWRA
jgi:hypothetical protein